MAYLLVLGFLSPFSNFVFPWTFTDFVGLPWPNYFILILGVYRFAINPLLSLLALLWACYGPFLLFFTSYTAHGFATCYFSLSGLFRAHLLFSRPIYLFHRPVIHYSCRLDLMVFCSLSFANFSSVCVAGLGFISFIFGFHKKRPSTIILKQCEFIPKKKKKGERGHRVWERREEERNKK